MKKEKKEKTPFKVLSKKGLASLALAGVMIASPVMLAGCSAGKDGQDGTMWYSGIDSPFESTGKVGDFYYDTDDFNIYKKGENGWVIISNIKGGTGTQGPIGNDGTSAYVGYDGYIWNGTERTQYKATDTTLGEGIVENTIGVEGTMSKYFDGSFVDLSENTVAVMSNFMPNAKLTGYSGTKITQIKIVASNNGVLHIGTAKVADIVDARTKGTSYTAKTTAYSVVSGLNTINVELNIENDETIVLGGQGSVGLYVAKGIPVEDEAGNFTLINGSAHSEVIEATNNIQDTLAIQVTGKFDGAIVVDSSTEASAIAAAGNQTASVSTYGISNPASAPWMYSSSKDAFAGKALSKIRIPVVSVDTITECPVFTIRVAKYNTSGTLITEANVRETIRLEIPLSEVENGVLDNSSAEGTQSTRGEYVVNKWITLDLAKYGVVVEEGETIVFGDIADTVRLAYSATSITGLDFYSLKGVPSTGNTANSMGYLADVIVADYTQTVSFEEHLELLKEVEEEAAEQAKYIRLKELLQGKYFSLIGDSISTYNGYCNDTDANSTLEDNVFRYDDSGKASGATVPFSSVNATWWMQTANSAGMELLVNNSWAGSEVFGERTGSNGVYINGAWEDRCVQLHDDNGERMGTNPDLIAVYLGINDYNFNRSKVGSGEINFDTLITDNGNGTFSYATPTEFKDAYAIMIHKMLTKYNQSQIFIFTLLPEDMYSVDKNSWELHNKYIRDVAEHFNLPIVDLAVDSGITWTNMHSYLHTDKIHPNEAGMDLITDCFLDVLIDYYVGDE